MQRGQSGTKAYALKSLSHLFNFCLLHKNKSSMQTGTILVVFPTVPNPSERNSGLN